LELEACGYLEEEATQGRGWQGRILQTQDLTSASEDKSFSDKGRRFRDHVELSNTWVLRFIRSVKMKGL
jgi:hypothetical protein